MRASVPPNRAGDAPGNALSDPVRVDGCLGRRIARSEWLIHRELKGDHAAHRQTDDVPRRCAQMIEKSGGACPVRGSLVTSAMQARKTARSSRRWPPHWDWA